MGEDILVSVIVPVYKVPAFIGKCVESLLDQTHKNLQIILVDDGSPDECGVLCDGYAQRDSRVQVIHKENGGLSDARNAGIEQAAGDYLAFVDGDDFVSEDYIETLLNACITNQTKMAACGYCNYYSDDRMTVLQPAESCVLSGEEAIKDIFTMGDNVQVMAWNKLYARSLFEDGTIRYPKGKIHEDVFTTYRFCAAAGKVACVNVPCYYYVQREGSIISQRFSPRRLQLLDAVESIRSFVEAAAPAYDREYEYYVFLNNLTLINAMADGQSMDKKLFAALRGKILKMLPDLKENPYFTKKDRLTCVFLRLGPGCFGIIRAIYKKFD